MKIYTVLFFAIVLFLGCIDNLDKKPPQVDWNEIKDSAIEKAKTLTIHETKIQLFENYISVRVEDIHNTIPQSAFSSQNAQAELINELEYDVGFLTYKVNVDDKYRFSDELAKRDDIIEVYPEVYVYDNQLYISDGSILTTYEGLVPIDSISSDNIGFGIRRYDRIIGKNKNFNSVKSFLEQAGVDYEPNFLTKMNYYSGPPFDPEQWYLNKDDPTNYGTKGIGHINIGSVWNDLSAHVVKDGPIIAVIDSEINIHHDYLKKNITNPWNTLNSTSNDTSVKPKSGVDLHGTMVAGLIAGNDYIVNTNFKGVCPWCKIRPVRVDLYNVTSTLVNVFNNLDIDNSVKVINCSWGLQKSKLSFVLRKAVNIVATNKVTVFAVPPVNKVIKANSTLLCNLGAVFTVGTTNWNDMKARYAKGDCIDVAAPGLPFLKTTTPLGDTTFGNTYGSSASAALVSGLFGLIYTKKPKLPVLKAKLAVTKYADKLSAKPNDPRLGAGRINVKNTIDSMK